jgi:DNA-3-methyladenine glycosylase I
MVGYHDTEWGVPVDDEQGLFERLSLECFQAGLSWSLILRRREGFREAFRGFEPAVVAGFDAGDVARLMADPGIVRNRAKIAATVGNAQAIEQLQADGSSLAAFLAPYGERAPRRLPPSAVGGDVPATTAASDALSAALRARGFRFVGSTVVYAFMQSVGLVDDHLPVCFRYGASAHVA